MEDAYKISRWGTRRSKSEGETERSSPFGDAVHKPAQEPVRTPPKSKTPSLKDRLLPPSQRALNQWLSKRHELGRSGLVNVVNEALVSQFGPLKIKGNITLIHEDGSTEHANKVTLCRCGHSRNKPYCDDQHIEKEFKDSGRFSQGSQSTMPLRPTALAITCIENGPLQFDGRMRVHDYLGQDCVKPKGKLCRCGYSTNKPFCDGSHEKHGFKSSVAKED